MDRAEVGNVAREIDFDALITLEEAARISGLERTSLKGYASRGYLRVMRPNKRSLMTTRRWLHDYLMSRNPDNMGKPSKDLPEDYIAPPPKRRNREESA